jgi:hypothetical protein
LQFYVPYLLPEVVQRLRGVQPLLLHPRRHLIIPEGVSVFVCLCSSKFLPAQQLSPTPPPFTLGSLSKQWNPQTLSPGHLHFGSKPTCHPPPRRAAWRLPVVSAVLHANPCRECCACNAGCDSTRPPPPLSLPTPRRKPRVPAQVHELVQCSE